LRILPVGQNFTAGRRDRRGRTHGFCRGIKILSELEKLQFHSRYMDFRAARTGKTHLIFGFSVQFNRKGTNLLEFFQFARLAGAIFAGAFRF